MESVGASRKIFEYLNRIPQILNDGTLTTHLEGSIEFKNVYFAYPTRPTLNVLKVYGIMYYIV